MTISPLRISARPILDKVPGVKLAIRFVGPSTVAAAKHRETSPAAACNAPTAPTAGVVVPVAR